MRFALCVYLKTANFLRALDFTTCLITQSLIDPTPELPDNFFMDGTKYQFLKPDPEDSPFMLDSALLRQEVTQIPILSTY
jgi:hypothetical protein